MAMIALLFKHQRGGILKTSDCFTFSGNNNLCLREN